MALLKNEAPGSPLSKLFNTAGQTAYSKVYAFLREEKLKSFELYNCELQQG